MSDVQEVLKKLLRSPKPIRKKDLLSDREYRLLAGATFEEFLALNFNADQLERLCSAEMDQLELYYQQMEQKVSRNLKRIRKKHTPTKPKGPRVVVRSTTPLLPIPQSVVAPTTNEEPAIDGTEATARQQSTTGTGLQELIEDLNASLEHIDLSQSMAPKELLLEEEVVAPRVLPESIDEGLDLGQPGDAGPFLGSDEFMPMNDPGVRNLVLAQFSSINRPRSGGRFEDLADSELMPPPSGGEFSASTPLAVPLGRQTALGSSELSAIKKLYKQTPPSEDIQKDGTADSGVEVPASETVDPRAETEPVAQDVAPIENPEGQVAADVPEPMQQKTVVPELMPPETIVPEPMEIDLLTEQPAPVAETQPRPPVQPVLPDSSSVTSSDSAERIPRPRNTARLVPQFGELVLTFDSRSKFDLFDDQDLNIFQPERDTMRALLAIRAARDAARITTRRPQQVPEGPPIAVEPREPDVSAPVLVGEQQPSLRGDQSLPFADLSSMREQSLLQQSSKLYPIQERPQREQVEEILIDALPVAAEQPAVPVRASDIPDASLLAPEVSANTRDSSSLEIPRIEITDTSKEQPPGPVVHDAQNVPQQVDILPELQELPQKVVAPQEVVPPQEGVSPPEGVVVPENTATGETQKKAAQLFKLYLSIQQETVINGSFTVEMARLEEKECVPKTRLNCCALFMNLLQLGKMGLIDIGYDEQSRIRSVTI